jgi:hypothetical protein
VRLRRLSEAGLTLPVIAVLFVRPHGEETAVAEASEQNGAVRIVILDAIGFLGFCVEPETALGEDSPNGGIAGLDGLGSQGDEGVARIVYDGVHFHRAIPSPGRGLVNWIAGE